MFVSHGISGHFLKFFHCQKSPFTVSYNHRWEQFFTAALLWENLTSWCQLHHFFRMDLLLFYDQCHCQKFVNPAWLFYNSRRSYVVFTSNCRHWRSKSCDTRILIYRVNAAIPSPSCHSTNKYLNTAQRSQLAEAALLMCLRMRS